MILSYNDEYKKFTSPLGSGIYNFFKPNKFSKLDDETASKIISKYNDTGLSVDALKEKYVDLDAGMASYLSTCDHGSATMAGYSKSIENVGFKAKATSVAMKGLSIAGNMLLGLGIGAAVQVGLSWLDNYIHRTERLVEAGEKARSSISETMKSYNSKVTGVTDLGKQFAKDTTSIKTTSDAIDSLTQKYSELKKGVNPDNSNSTLSSNEYQQYLDISNQLSSIFPTLKTGADAQGNSLISLGTNASVASKSLQELLETQKMITHTEISGKSKDAFDGAYAQSKDIGKEIKQLKSERKALETEIKGRQDVKKSIQNDTMSLYGITEKDSKKVLDAIGKTLNKDPKKEINHWNTTDDDGWTYHFQLEPDIDTSKMKEVSTAVEAALKSNTEILTGQLGETNAQLTAKQEEQKQAWASFADEVAKPFIQTSPQLNNIPQELTEAVTNNLSSMNWGNIYDKYNGDAQFALLDSFVIPLQNLKKPAQEALTEALQLDPSKLSIKDYEKQVNSALSKITKDKSGQKEWKKLFGFDERIADAKDESDALVKLFSNKKKEIDALSGQDREWAYKIAIEDEEFDGQWQDVMAKIEQFKTVTANSSMTFDGLLKSAATWMQKIDNINAALVNSVSGKGLNFSYEEDEETGIVTLTGDLANLQNAYKDLDGYDPALLFEKTTNGVHLNRDALRQLQAQEEATNKAEFIKKRLDLQNELNTALSQQKTLSKDSAEWETAQGTIDSLQSQIQNIDLLASAYDGATSAYQKWINAQSAGEEGDMYDTIRDTALDRGKELYDKGLVGTEEFRAIADLFSYEDLSTAPVEQVVAAYENAAPSIKKFFTDGREGVDGFVESMKSISDANNMGWVDVLEDGSYKFNTGDDDAIARELGIDVEAVQAIYKKLKDYGAEGIQIGDTSGVENYSDRLKELEANAESAKEKLNEMAGTDLKFNFDSQSIDNLSSQIDQANQIVQNLPKNEDGTINVHTDGAQESITVLQTLIQKREELASSQNIIMRVNAEENEPVNTLQNFQHAKDELDTLNQLNAQGIQIDTSEAQGNVDDLMESVQKIADEHPELELDTSSADALEESLSHLSEEQLLALDVDTSQLDTAQEKLDAIKGMNEFNVSVNVNGKSDVDALGNELSSLPPNTPANISVNVQDSSQLDNTVQQLEKVPPDTTANFTFSVQNADEAETLSSKIAELNGERDGDHQITYTMNIVPGDNSAESQIETLTQPKEANVNVKVNGQEQLIFLQGQLSALNTENAVNVAVNYTKKGEQTPPEEKSAAVNYMPIAYQAPPVNMSASVNYTLGEQAGPVNKTAIVNYVAVGAVPGSGAVATGTMLSPAHVDGTAYNVINTKPISAYANGKVSLPHDEVALSCEMGQESIIRAGAWHLLPPGMHMQAFKKGDIILNATQTADLLRSGKASGHGKAYADGTVGNVRSLAATSLSNAYSAGSSYKPGKNIGGSGSKAYSSSKSESSNSSSTPQNTAAVDRNTDSTDENTKSNKSLQDWIEQLVSVQKAENGRLYDAIEDFEMNANQNKAIDTYVGDSESYMDTLRQAQNRYMTKANALGIPGNYVHKIWAGELDIEDIQDEDLKEKISQYQTWCKSRPSIW